MRNPIRLSLEASPSLLLGTTLAFAPLFGRSPVFQALFALAAIFSLLRCPPRVGKACYAFAAFFAFAALSLLFSIDRFATLGGLSLLGCGFLAFLLASSQKIEESADAILFAGLFVEIAAIGLFLYDSLHFNAPRWGGPFYRTNDLAGFLILLLPVALARLAGVEKKLPGDQETLTKLVCALGLAEWIATWSRAGWFAGAIGLLAWFFLSGRREPKKYLPLFFAALLLAILFGRGHDFFGRISSVAPSKLSQPTENSLVWRESLRRDALSMALDHPLLGTGYATFAEALPRYQKRAGFFAHDAHNHFLQLGVELGLLGGLGFALFLFYLLSLGFKQRGEPLMAGFLAASLASAVHAAFDIDWSVPGIALAFWAIAGALSMPEKTDEKKTEAHPLSSKALPFILASVPLYFSLLSGLRDLGAWRILDPLFPFSGKAKVNLALQERDPQRAISLLDEAEKLEPFDANIPFIEGKLLAQGDKAGAKACFKRAIDLNPFRSPAYYRAFADLSDGKAAISMLETALTRFPSENLPSYESYSPSVRPALLGIALSLKDRLLLRQEKGRAAEVGRTIESLLGGARVSRFDPRLMTPWKTIETFWGAIEGKDSVLLGQVLEPSGDLATCNRLISELRGMSKNQKVVVREIRAEGEEAMLEYAIGEKVFRNVLSLKLDGWHLRYP